jgi:hypothetical protein
MELHDTSLYSAPKAHAFPCLRLLVPALSARSHALSPIIQEDQAMSEHPSSTSYYMLQEHPMLAWPLFIFLLSLAFYLYPEDYVRIHMQYLFWLTVLSPFLYWLYFL